MLIVDKVCPGLLYLIRSPVVTIPANTSPALVKVDTVFIPTLALAPTLPPPNDFILEGIKSPVNVLPTPLLAHKD